jgi:hypothetical protein
MNTLGGELSSHLLSVMLLTLAIAPLILWRYRRAVLAGMMASPGTPVPLAPALPLPAETATPADGAAEAALRWEKVLHRRVLVAAIAATFVAALPISALYLPLNELPLSPAHLYLKAGVLSLTAVPVYAVLTATPGRRAIAIGVLVLVALAGVGVVLSMLQRPFYGKAPSVDQAMNFVVFVQLAGLTLWLPLLLGLATGARRVRGVAPIVLAGLLVFGLAALLGSRLTQWLTATRTGAEWVLGGVGLDTGFVLIALPVGLLAWWRLKALALGYEAKRFSDAQLLARTWWLLVVAAEAIERISAHPALMPMLEVLAVSALSVAMYGPLLALGLRWADASPGRPPPRTLLVLRVFGDAARSEALFDRIVSRWRWFGPVTMIAGPDVVARTVDPGDFLRFAAGDIAASFVATSDDLGRRLAALDARPDPDGRYRVNEFCCRDNSWQATVVRLIDSADTVLMDLRGFNAQRAGCAFELGELGRRRWPSQVVLLVDAGTDRARLGQLLGEAAVQLPTLEVAGNLSAQSNEAIVALLRAAR